jgi:hypothetical protein
VKRGLVDKIFKEPTMKLYFYIGQILGTLTREIKDLRNVLGFAERRLKEHESINGIFNIYINVEKIRSGRKAFAEFGKKEKTELASVIYNSILSYAQQQNSSLPDFIEDIIITPDSTINLSLAETYWLNKIDTGYLENAILAKSEKIKDYREQHSLTELWLLVAIDGACSSSSFEYLPEMLPTTVPTEFSEIFLYNLFDEQVISGKNIGLMNP